MHTSLSEPSLYVPRGQGAREVAGLEHAVPVDAQTVSERRDRSLARRRLEGRARAAPLLERGAAHSRVPLQLLVSAPFARAASTRVQEVSRPAHTGSRARVHSRGRVRQGSLAQCAGALRARRRLVRSRLAGGARQKLSVPRRFEPGVAQAAAQCGRTAVSCVLGGIGTHRNCLGSVWAPGVPPVLGKMSCERGLTNRPHECTVCAEACMQIYMYICIHTYVSIYVCVGKL